MCHIGTWGLLIHTQHRCFYTLTLSLGYASQYMLSQLASYTLLLYFVLFEWCLYTAWTVAPVSYNRCLPIWIWCIVPFLVLPWSEPLCCPSGQLFPSHLWDFLKSATCYLSMIHPMKGLNLTFLFSHLLSLSVFCCLRQAISSSSEGPSSWCIHGCSLFHSGEWLWHSLCS